MYSDPASRPVKREFDAVYDKHIIGGAFLEKTEYYHFMRERYWKTLCFIQRDGLLEHRRIVEFGGGQMAILLNKMYGINATVADISNDFRGPIDHAGIPFVVGNLLEKPSISHDMLKFDLVILLEVIEHIYMPPHVVFENIRSILSPLGSLFLTTPNLFRLRNTIRMIRGHEPFDRFMIPIPGVGPGHQMEYSADHMSWQIERAGLKVRSVYLDQLGHVGHSMKARLARRLLAPLLIIPMWREELVITADNNFR